MLASCLSFRIILGNIILFRGLCKGNKLICEAPLFCESQSYDANVSFAVMRRIGGHCERFVFGREDMALVLKLTEYRLLGGGLVGFCGPSPLCPENTKVCEEDGVTASMDKSLCEKEDLHKVCPTVKSPCRIFKCE